MRFDLSSVTPARIRQKAGERAPELIFLLVILVPAGLLFAFLKLASEVFEGETLAFDRTILLALRNPADLADPIGPQWLEILMRDLTSLGSTTVLTIITLSAVGLLMVERRWATALFVVVAVGGGTLLSSLLKFAFARPRPDLVAHSVDVYTASFPSGHAMLSAVTYLTLAALLVRAVRRFRIRLYILGCAVALTVSIGISRVYLGVHYPTDVLAGWTVGSAWALGCGAIAWRLQQRGKIELRPRPNDGLIRAAGT